MATQPTPKQATEQRQASLVAAALALAAQRSPADITTADLAQAVGITQGAVFRHFESKTSIWLAVMDAVHDDLLARHREDPATSTRFLRSLLLFDPDSQLYLLGADGTVLARTGAADKVKSATFFTAQVDFEKAGDLLHFVDDQQIDTIRQLSPQIGDMHINGSIEGVTFRQTRVQ